MKTGRNAAQTRLGKARNGFEEYVWNQVKQHAGGISGIRVSDAVKLANAVLNAQRKLHPEHPKTH